VVLVVVVQDLMLESVVVELEDIELLVMAQVH